MGFVLKWLTYFSSLSGLVILEAILKHPYGLLSCLDTLYKNSWQENWLLKISKIWLVKFCMLNFEITYLAHFSTNFNNLGLKNRSTHFCRIRDGGGEPPPSTIIFENYWWGPPRPAPPHPTPPHPTPPHPTSPHLTSPHLTSPHLTSPHLLFCKSVDFVRNDLLLTGAR